MNLQHTGVDDTAKLLLAEDRPGGLGDLVGAINVDREDGIPLLIGHTGKGDILEDTGVVDDNVDTAKGLHGSLDNLVSVKDRVVVGNGFTTSGTDLIDNKISSAAGGSLTSVGTTEIVDDNRGTARSKEEGVRLAESTTGTSHDDNATVKSKVVSHIAVVLLEFKKEGRV